MSTQKNDAIELITAPSVPRPGGHYSHAARAGNLLFVSGVLPVAVNPGDSFEAQSRAAMDQCQRILEAARCGWTDVAQCTVYIADVSHWPEFNRIYADYLKEHRPARVVVPVPGLHHGYLIEVQVTAMCPEYMQAFQER